MFTLDLYFRPGCYDIREYIMTLYWNKPSYILIRWTKLHLIILHASFLSDLILSDWREGTRFNPITSAQSCNVFTLCLRYVSGLVAVTSMDFGLFIVEPDYEAMAATAKNKNYGEQTRYVVREEIASRTDSRIVCYGCPWGFFLKIQSEVFAQSTNEFLLLRQPL